MHMSCACADVLLKMEQLLRSETDKDELENHDAAWRGHTHTLAALSYSTEAPSARDMTPRFSSVGCAFRVGSGFEPIQTSRCARIQSAPSRAALPRLLTVTGRARNAMAATQRVVMVDNNRGDSSSSYRARALGAGAQEVSRDTASTHAGWQPLPGTCC